MPRLDPGMQSGKIIEWLKKEGDPIKQDEPVAKVEGEKTTFEVNSPGAGVIRKLLHEPGTDVEVGHVMALVGEPTEPLPSDTSLAETPVTTTPATSASMPTPESQVTQVSGRGHEPAASPVARKMAREAGIDLSKIKGSGPGGRIVREDIQKVIEEAGERPQEVRGPSQARIVPIAKTIKLAGKRKAVAERLSYGFHTTVPVTITMEAPMNRLFERRESLRADGAEDVSITAYVVKAVAKALEDHAMINSSLEQDEIRLFGEINVAVAINTPDGLVAPVIPQTNRKSLLEVSRAIRDLTERAMQNALSVPDLTGGTFTVTNLGGYGVELFAPVINPPQCAILGFGKTSEKAVVIGKEIRAMLMTTLSLVFDHRIVDGVPAARFLQRVKDLLEAPDNLE